MLASCTDARDIPPADPFVGYPNRLISAVICIICDAGYYRNDFVKIVLSGQGTMVTKHLMICPNHDMSQISDIVDGDSITDKYVITALKKRVQSLQQELETSKILKEQNTELRAHNNELREHNALLRNLMAASKNTSYADTLKGEKPKPKPLESANIIITPHEKFTGNMKQLIEQEILKTKTPVSEIRKTKQGKFIVKCDNDTAADRIRNSIGKKIGHDAKILKEEKKNPLLKIVNLKNELDKQELEEDICVRNELPTDQVKVVHVYTNRKNQTRSAIIAVSSHVYAKIMTDESVYAGFQRCRVFNEFNLNRCYKCCGYGHSANKCKSGVTCARCAGPHDTKTCVDENVTVACANCIGANKALRNKRKVDHEARDAQKCDTYKVLWDRVISMTNYPYQPTFSN